MKKIIIRILLLSSLFFCLPVNSQTLTSTCQYSTCVPKFNFSGTDWAQVYGVLVNILDALNGGGAPITGSVVVTNSVNVYDDNNDSININLVKMRVPLYYGSTPISFITKDIADRNIVTGGAFIGSSTCDMLVNNRILLSYINGKLDSIKPGLFDGLGNAYLSGINVNTSDIVTNTQDIITTLLTQTLSTKLTNTISVNINGTPSVNVTDTVKTRVTNTVAVNINGTPSVNVTNTVNANVTNTVNANVTNTVSVKVVNTATVSGTVGLSTNAQLTAITNTLGNIAVLLENQVGNQSNGSGALFTSFENTDLASLTTAINNWMAANTGNTILSVSYSSYKGTTTSYSALIFYR